MFDHVLVPLDGSPLAECVLPHAITLARAFNTRLTVLRVLSCPATINSERRLIDPLDWELHKMEALAYLDEIVKRLQDADVEAQHVLLEGQPGPRIIEFTAAHDVDLILLSTHGQSGLSGWNVSSVVQKVLMRANVSMMLVRAYQPAEPADSAAVHYRRVLLPLDGSQRAECVFSPATTLASFHNAHLLVVHVVHRPQMSLTRPDAQDVALVDRLIEHRQRAATKYLDGLYSRLSSTIQTRLVVADDVAVRLHEIVEEENVDLVILSAHGHSGRTEWPYGSITTGFINYGATPLLIVQDLAPDEVEPMYAAVATRERSGH